MEEAPLDKKRSRSKERGLETEPQTNSRPPEKLGHLLMTASEKAPISHTGQSALEAVGRLITPERLSDKKIETLSRAELLRLSEEIIVDGSSLRQVYETHLIGERGLRHLIAEHQRGADLKKALRQEIISREMDFERDPALRDTDIPQVLSDDQVRKADKAALNELLEQAAASLDDTSEEAAFYKARALYEASQLQQHRQQRRWIDVTLAFAIAVLFILVIVLLSRR